MMKKSLFVLALLANSLFAHTALMSCFNNGDNTITCEGGFSDGSSASGVKFFVLQNDKKILDTRMNEDSEVTFNIPSGSYSAVFDAGDGHQIHVKDDDITE
ncbi:hypothetical protein CRV03_02010 [Arcobacter sp. F155]|uniref:hypothetical protein n=1 Tax=Arcobacter sp. F155 TaxID=2044512 RepID=UPI00100A5736|nr:hypothetical protein CRV03_02010 [Arcobacter sp. F155]